MNIFKKERDRLNGEIETLKNKLSQAEQSLETSRRLFNDATMQCAILEKVNKNLTEQNAFLRETLMGWVKK